MRVLLAVVLLAAAVSALPPFVDEEARTLLLERRSSPPEWNMIGDADDSAPFTFVLGLKQRNLDQLEARFWAVSDPKSSSYRQFMTQDQIMQLVAPPESERLFVKNWLLQHGVSRVVDRQDNFEVHASVAVVESLFRTQMFTFQHRSKDTKIVRQMGAYSLPAAIFPRYVDLVASVSDFPPLERNLHVATPAAGTPAVVPQSLIQQYNIPSTYNGTGASQGVAEFEAGQYFSPSELQTFAQQVNIPITPLTKDHIVDPIPPVGVEGTLDIQYIAALAPGAVNWYWSNAVWLYEWATAVAAAKDKPDVFSISYGWSESDQCEIDEQGCQTLGGDSQHYVARVNTEFQKIGLQGVSLLSASGDSGANGRTDPDCTAPTLRPDYPGSSPYLTAVGATQFNNPNKALPKNPPVCQAGQGWSCLYGGQESAVSFDVAQFTSGGGFSNYAPRPSYQEAAVSAYFSSGVQLPPAAMWNRTNRGYPDVASNGHNVLIYSADLGGIAAVGGTSASSPSFAAYMSLLNQVVKKKTGKPLGFLNPFLYQMHASQPNTFTDITVGDNICTESGCSSTCHGYYAYKGWDPVTGLGVANVGNMLQYVSNHLHLFH